MNHLVTIFVLVNMSMLLGEALLHPLGMCGLSLVDSFNSFPKYCAIYTSTSVRV